MENNKIYHIILSLFSGEATDEELDILEQWLEESGNNRSEFAAFQRLYSIAVSKRKEQDFNVDRAWERVKPRTVNKKKRNYFRISLSYAAMLAILFAGIYYLLNSGSTVETPQLVSIENLSQPVLLLENGEHILLSDTAFSLQKENTIIKNDSSQTLIYNEQEADITAEEKIILNHLMVPKGTNYSVILSDGTSVYLNSQSTLVYPVRFAGNVREVKLMGEAYFEVSTSEEQPFIVKTDLLDIKVTGTSFNVCNYEEEQTAKTVLVEGEIYITTKDGYEQKIQPSELFVFNKDSEEYYTEIVNTRHYTAWINNTYIFRNACLADIIVRLQRWHDFTVVYKDESLKQRRFSITVDRATAIDQLLEIISYTTDIQLERINNSIYIQRKEVQ